MHYLITGHTGFKGAWLALLLHEEGNDVSGVSLPPEPGSLFETAGVASVMASDLRVDIRNSEALRRAFRDCQPDVVIHLAAQPLVRASYEQPRETVETNVLGTFNVLEALSELAAPQACLVVTTDKVYRNVGLTQGYVESAPLGGHDPYSASKSMADILVQSWVASFPSIPTAVARAGNVVGGGDIGRDRLLPDLITAFRNGRTARVRNPDSVRPWQHVLDCLSGYTLLVDALLAGESQTTWNIGPEPANLKTVGNVADLAAHMWSSGAKWEFEEGAHPHEASMLTLDSSAARSKLGWRDRLTFEETIGWTLAWERRRFEGERPVDLCREQIAAWREL